MLHSFLAKSCILFVLLAGLLPLAHSQGTGRRDFGELITREDSLEGFGFSIVNAREAAERFRADSNFTRMLVRALREKNSFHYPFDSLQTISRVYAPDSSFRIFTWQVIRDEKVYRRRGAIQMRTTDGSLRLYPLIDKSHILENGQSVVTQPDSWFGAIYYKVILTTHNGKTFYTLLGYDENSFRSTRKRIEVLTFNEQGKPWFGGPYFSFENAAAQPLQTRFWIEYKKDANARLQYDPEMNLIIFDHLIPENNEADKKYTYIPDGDYEGFQWKNGKWVHVNKVFDFKLKDGEAPAPVPVKEDKFRPPFNPPT